MKILLLLCASLAWAQAPIASPFIGALSGASPGGAAGGDLSGTYPNPTIASIGGKAVTLGGALTTSGAFASTFTMTGTTGVTFPTSGTLATTTSTDFVKGAANLTTSGAIPFQNGTTGTVTQVAGLNWNGTTLTVPSLTDSGQLIVSLNGASATPPVAITGSWVANSNTCQVLVQATGTTAFSGSASGSGLCVNAVTGFGGSLADFQVAGVSKLVIGPVGQIVSNSLISAGVSSDIQWTGSSVMTATSNGVIRLSNNAVSAGIRLDMTTNGTLKVRALAGGDTAILDVNAATITGITTSPNFRGTAVLFANLATAFPNNGDSGYSSDSTVTSGADDTCVGSGTGAWVVRLNGVYRCQQ